MKGSTGTSQTLVRIWSGTKNATDLRQKRLKQSTASHFVNVHKLTGAAGAYRALKKMQRLNDLDRRGSQRPILAHAGPGRCAGQASNADGGSGKEAEPIQPAEPDQPLLGDGEAEVKTMKMRRIIGCLMVLSIPAVLCVLQIVQMGIKHGWRALLLGLGTTVVCVVVVLLGIHLAFDD